MGEDDVRSECLILAMLTTHGTITMDQLAMLLPQLSWNRVFQVVDTLSRTGQIVLRRRGLEYEVAIPTMASQSLTLSA